LEGRPKATMIVATYIRNSTEEKLGIGLQQINDKLVISVSL
jgi:hypothetical protein